MIQPLVESYKNMTSKKAGFTHESTSNKSIEWYTPKWVFDALGVTFDLDVCAPEAGIDWVPAAKHYSIKDDGLTAPWIGKVWCNPPYGPHTKKWLTRMNKHRNGVALVFARTDCAWFHDSCTKADGILFLRGRIKFVDGLGVTANSGPGSGSMLIAWGSEGVRAIQKMAHMGFFFTPDQNAQFDDDDLI